MSPFTFWNHDTRNRNALWVSLGLAILLSLFLIGVGFRLETLPHPPQAEFSDATISRFPDALHIQRSLQDHHTIPLWNAHLMGGQPFAANPGTKLPYPLTWLLLILPPALHINLMTGFHLWLGAVGMWRFARQTGLEHPYALLSAIGVMLAPKLLAHAGAGHTDLLIAIGWTPWLLLTLNPLICQGITSRYIAGLGLAIGMIFIGAVQLIPYIYGLGAIYAIFLGLQTDEKSKKLASLLGGGLLGAGLSAGLWIPLWGLRDVLSRGDIQKADAAMFSTEGGHFFGLLIGNHGGSAEAMTYVGVSLLILAVFGLILRPKQNRFWWGVVGFSALYALGENFILWNALVDIFPPLLWFRVPSRAWFIIALVLPYLAGWGLKAIVEKPPQHYWGRLGVVGLIGFGFVCAGSSLAVLQETEIEQSALIGLFFLPSTGLLIAFMIFETLSQRYLVPAFILLVTLDLLWIGITLIEGRPQSDWLQKTPPPTIAHLAESGGRIYTPDYAIPQQNTAYWGIARFDGVDPFQLNAFTQIADDATGVPNEGYSTTVPAVVVFEEDEESLEYQDAPINAELLGKWGVEYVITGYPLQIEGLTLETQSETEQDDQTRYFYRNEQYAWADMRLTWQTPSQVTISNAPPNAQDLRIIMNAPHWEQNGEIIPSQNLTLPPQDGTYSYQPPTLSFIVTALAYLFLFGMATFGKRPTKPTDMVS